MITMYNWKKIGERVRLEREKRGLTMEAMADRIGTSRQTVSRWERGDGVEITLNMLLRMCDIFECELGYMLCEYDCKTREATDICKATGLSEAAVAHIISMYNVSRSSNSDTANVAVCGMDLLNLLLEGGASYLLLSSAVSLYHKELSDPKAYYDIFSSVDGNMGEKFLEYTITSEFLKLIKGDAKNV